jgi:fructose-1,6-bisphosphatase/inositol monophosphatase family enzyme
VSLIHTHIYKHTGMSNAYLVIKPLDTSINFAGGIPCVCVCVCVCVYVCT